MWMIERFVHSPRADGWSRRSSLSNRRCEMNLKLMNLIVQWKRRRWETEGTASPENWAICQQFVWIVEMTTCTDCQITKSHSRKFRQPSGRFPPKRTRSSQARKTAKSFRILARSIVRRTITFSCNYLFFFSCAHLMQYHLPLGFEVSPTQPKWNHSIGQSRLSHPIISPVREAERLVIRASKPFELYQNYQNLSPKT